MRSESQFLVDLIGRLDAAGADYMLTGSIASNYWGIPRTVHALDVALMLKPEDVNRFVAAIQPGLFIQAQSVRSAFRPPYRFNVLDEQSALKADFWMLREDGFEQTAFTRRLQVTLFGVPAWICTAEDVILHKLYWNRLTPSERQLGDTAGVYSVQRDALDVDYLRRWATYLEVTRELDDLIAGKIKPKTT